MTEGSRFTWAWPHKPAGRRGVSREELTARQQALARAPLFAGLPKRHLQSIARATVVSWFDAGDAVVTEGHRESSFYVVLQGRVRVLRRGRTVALLEPGDFFGEISLLDEGPRTATVRAEEPTVCLNLAGADLRKILEAEPALAVRMLREVARRWRESGRTGTSSGI